MQKRKNIKDQLISTTKSSKLATEERLNQLDLNERIDKAEAVIHGKKKGKELNTEKAIRDAFTMQRSDIVAIKEIRKNCLSVGLDVNKSIIVRAGILALKDMSIDDLNEIINRLPKIKIGRPKE